MLTMRKYNNFPKQINNWTCSPENGGNKYRRSCAECAWRKPPPTYVQMEVDLFAYYVNNLNKFFTECKFAF